MIARRHNFTLIEILVVVVLISLLVGITVPAYTKIMTGNAVSYSARIITSQLNMARVEACAKRKMVAVVFLNEKNFSYKQDELGIYNRRAFRACYVEKSGDDYNFDKWVPGTKWEMLPNGAFFAGTTKGGMTDTCMVKKAKDDMVVKDSGGNITKDYRLFSDNSTIANAVIYDTTGRPEEASQIVVMEGKVNSNDSGSSLSDDDTNESLRKPNKANWAKITVNQYTGKTKVEMPEE